MAKLLSGSLAAFAVFVFTVTFMQRAYGIKCYDCSYIKVNRVAIRGSAQDDSCDLENSPSSKYLSDCNKPGMHHCILVSVTGKTSLDEEFEMVVRRCIGLPDTVDEQKCKSQPYKKWRIGNDSFSKYITSFRVGYKDNMKVAGCYCARDLCNSANLWTTFPPVLVTIGLALGYTWHWAWK